LRRSHPKEVPAYSGNQFGVKLSLPCCAFVYAADPSITK
jgi:hypothetical protein